MAGLFRWVPCRLLLAPVTASLVVAQAARGGDRSRPSLGFIDAVGGQNVLAPNAGLTVKPVTALTLDGTVFRFARASAADALYNAGGGVERPAGAAVAKAVGTELDLTGTYRVGSRVVVLAGYSGLWAGDFIRETGAAGTISFAYSSLQVSY